MDESLSRIQVSFSFLERNLNNISCVLPLTVIFSAKEDGSYDMVIEPFSIGSLPVLKSYDYLFLLPTIPLHVSFESLSNQFQVTLLQNRPFLLSSFVRSISYENTSSAKGELKVIYYTTHEKEVSIVTWGSTTVEMGTESYTMGG